MYKIELKYSTDIIWDPVTNKMNPEYLFLTYGPASHMKYPENWKERMRMWEVTIQTMENIKKFKTEINEIGKINSNKNKANESLPKLDIV